MKILTLDGLRLFKDNILNVVNNTIDEKISDIKCDISLEDISESIDDVNIDYVTTEYFNSVIGDINTILNKIIS